MTRSDDAKPSARAWPQEPRIAEIPPKGPRRGSAFSRWLGRTVLRWGGWHVEGDWPDLPRMVVIIAPHSSAWDAFWGIAAELAMGVDIVFMAKKEAFVGPLGWLLRYCGGVPVDRKAPAGVIAQAAARIRGSERCWFVLAPEGTRRPVETWRTGFWHIAKDADVPVCCAWLDYPTRRVGIGPLVTLSDDRAADMIRIRELFRPYQGKRRGVF